MSKISVLLLWSLLLLLPACKEKSATDTVSGEMEKSFDSPFTIEAGGNYASLAAIRPQTKAVIDDRISKDDNAQSSLTFTYWYPEFVFNKSMSDVDEFKGHWIKFNDDFTYNYGLNSAQKGSGMYHYRLDDSALVMLDNNEDVEPKFWKVQHNGQAMALVGLHELSINNGMQMKLLAMDQAPMN